MTKRLVSAAVGIAVMLAAARGAAEEVAQRPPTAPEATTEPAAAQESEANPSPEPAASVDAGACDGVPCSGHGRCVVVRDGPACACEGGYVADQRTGLNCISTEVLARLTILLHRGGDEATLPSDADRQVTVRSQPAGAVVTIDEPPAPGPGPRPLPGPMGSMDMETTPHTFTASPGEHTLHLRRPGFENADVPVVVGEGDLLIDVRLSRPVHEWGIALSAIGGALVIAGLGVMAADLLEHDSPESTSSWAALLGVGGGLTIGGLLMVFLDRNHASTATIAPAAEPTR